MMSPGVIDPALMGEKRFVSVPVDELRAMITEAVKKAVEGIEGIGKNIVEGRTQKMAAIDEVEDVAESIEGCEDDEGDTIAVKVDGSEL